jgi:hypothetical protein
MYVCTSMYVWMNECMYKEWATKTSPCTATFEDLFHSVLLNDSLKQMPKFYPTDANVIRCLYTYSSDLVETLSLSLWACPEEQLLPILKDPVVYVVNTSSTDCTYFLLDAYCLHFLSRPSKITSIIKLTS